MKYTFYFELSIFHKIFSFINVVTINLFQIFSFFSSIFSSTIEVFKAFSYNNIITLIQSLNLVYLISNFESYSLVNETAILVNRAVLHEIILPAPGLIKLIVEELIVEADPVSISVIINNIFFI